MDLIGAVLVFLVSVCAGLLLGIYLALSRFIRRTGEHITGAQEHAERRAAERHAHLDATAAIVMERVRLVGAAVAAQLRETAAEQRNDLRLVLRLPVVQLPGHGPSRRAAPSASTAPRSAPGAATSSRGRFATPSAPRAAPSTLGDDDATPPSGFTPDEVRERTHRDGEQTP